MSWERIDFYRVKTGKTLKEVSAALGVGVGMIMMVKTGKRRLSGKALYRLEQAEREAGIATATPLDRACESAERDGALHLSPAAYAATSPQAARLIAEATPEMQKMADLFSAFARIESKLDSITSRLDKIEKRQIK